MGVKNTITNPTTMGGHKDGGGGGGVERDQILDPYKSNIRPPKK